MNKAQRELKDYLKEEKITKETLEQKIYPCFKKQMGYDRAEELVLQDTRKIYSRYIEKKLLIQYYYDEERLEKAISLLTAACDSGSFEWGILFHHEGIVLINSQIPKGESAYKANKIVFRFGFGRPSEFVYFKYLSYENLLVTQNTKFFSDIIIFRNVGYEKSPISWSQYLSTTRRVFDYFCEHDRGYSQNVYDEISVTDLEQCLRERSRTKKDNYITNQFRYMNKFMKWKAPNGQFASQSVAKLLNDFKDVTEQHYVEEISFDSKELRLLFRKVQKEQNAERNQVLLLLMFAYGMERRQLRMLCWDDLNLNSIRKASIKIEEKRFPLPSTLAEKLIELKRILNADERRYVLGNCYTRNVRPLSGDGINSILSSITNREKFQNSYHNITVANVRKWLFKYLISEKYNIVAVMQMMNVSVQNLYNYVSKEQFIDFSRGDVKGIEEMSEHPMEAFIKDIFME